MSPWMLLLQDLVIGVVWFIAIAAVVLWVWVTSGCGGMRLEHRPAVLPPLWSALRQRAQGLAYRWRHCAVRYLYRCVPWFRASNKPN